MDHCSEQMSWQPMPLYSSGWRLLETQHDHGRIHPINVPEMLVKVAVHKKFGLHVTLGLRSGPDCSE
jgi:hypothetical protein